MWVVADGRAEKRDVTLGGNAGAQVVVVSGLRAGEQIVVEPPENLRDGDRVSNR